jgi:hypothetical protein
MELPWQKHSNVCMLTSGLLLCSALQGRVEGHVSGPPPTAEPSTGPVRNRVLPLSEQLRRAGRQTGERQHSMQACVFLSVFPKELI